MPALAQLTAPLECSANLEKPAEKMELTGDSEFCFLLAAKAVLSHLRRIRDVQVSR